MFKVQSVFFLFAAAIVLSLACSAVLEAGTITYQASADPTTVDGDLGQPDVQPWVPAGPSTTGIASTGGGGPIWLVENAAGNRWSLAPVSADNESAWRNGWTIDMNYVIPVGSTTCSIWSNRFCLEFGNATHGIRLYQGVYDTTMPQYDAKFHLDIGNGTSFVAAPGVANVIDAAGNHTSQLHTLKLVYTPGTGTGTGLDLFMDNELRINDLQLPAATADCTLRWGRDSGTGSVADCYVGYESVSLGITSVPEPTDSFTIVVFPDIQNEVTYNPAMLKSQVDWVINNKTSRNIAFACAVGDLTNAGNDQEFTIAHNDLFRLNNVNGLAWGTCGGNHDLCFPGTDNPDPARGSRYDQYFGPSNFAGKSWYGTSNSSHSSYQIFNADGRHYLVLDLEHQPNPDVLSWAQGVIDANPYMPVIINTHDYLSAAGDYLPSEEGIMPYANALWDGLINDNPRIFLVLCGHVTQEGPSKYATRTNAAGLSVYELMDNFQSVNLGNGYLRLLEFDEENSVIRGTVYSPYTNAYYTNYPGTIEIPVNFKERFDAVCVPIPGDADLNGIVDEFDAAIVAANWQKTDNIDWRCGDFNGDGIVDDIDVALMAANWGLTATASLPEPTIARLVLIMLLSWFGIITKI